MEGMGLFNLAGTGGDANMRTAVHTRRIINPFWGTRLTGSAGKLTFGVLNASEESPRELNAPETAGAANKFFTIGRAMYSLGGSNYAGVLVTDTEYAGRHNRAGGGDISFKPSPTQQFSATFLATRTRNGSEAATHGTASQVSYSFNSRRISWSTQVEHYGRGFELDTAFYNRTGLTTGWSFGEISFYPRDGSDFWVKRVQPFYFLRLGRDQVQDGNEAFLNTGIRINFTRQGYLNISHARGHEPWMGQRYRTGGGINVNGNVQILRWLNFGGHLNTGREIFYDRIAPFQGKSTARGFQVTLQPNEHFSQSVDVNDVSFRREATAQSVFDVSIINTRTTWQFNRHFLVRLIEQFDSSSHRLLTDLLASYEFVPGTVLHAGYGSLYEKDLRDVVGRYRTISRGLFFKASYRWRF
jgi:hypothetical protein